MNSKQPIDFSQFTPSKNLSIPNLISLLRLLIIPFIFIFYLKGKVWVAADLVILSGITDAVDGYLARHLNQITPLGKILDPIADKLTQVALGICLLSRFPEVIPLVAVLVIKELLMLFWGVRLLKAGKPPFSALWWGKLSTVAFYFGIIIIMLFSRYLGTIGVAIISVIITLLMLNSLIRYGQVFHKMISSAQQ